MEYQPVFVIRRNNGNDLDYCNYSAHGEIGGVADAIGYDKTAHARKYHTAEEAQKFIDTELPEWGRGYHHPVEVKPWDLLYCATPLQGALQAAMWLPGVKISDDLLKPTPGRLLIWRR